jgi:O-antigen biosynthesis protein
VLIRDRDLRVLPTVLVFLPIYYAKRLLRWVLGDRAYPLSLTWVEIQGILAGPWGLWQSHRLIRKIGRLPRSRQRAI